RSRRVGVGGEARAAAGPRLLSHWEIFGRRALAFVPPPGRAANLPLLGDKPDGGKNTSQFTRTGDQDFQNRDGRPVAERPSLSFARRAGVRGRGALFGGKLVTRAGYRSSPASSSCSHYGRT